MGAYSSGGSGAGCFFGRVDCGLVKIELVQELHRKTLLGNCSTLDIHSKIN